MLAGGDNQVVEHLSSKVLDVVGVDQLVDQVQGPLSDGDVRVLQAVDDGVSVSLDRGSVFGDDFREGVQGHVTNVVVAVEKEATQDIDGQDAETGFGFDGHDGLDALVQDGIACVLGRFGVGGHLGQEVVHGVAGFRVAFPQALKHVQKLDLEEGVGDTRNVMIGGIPHRQEISEEAEDGGDQPREGWGVGRVHAHDLCHELDPCQ